MELIAYIASLFIGVCLGLIGACGGILIVPVMVYLFHVPALMATSYSLFIVGLTSLLASFYKSSRGEIRIRPAIFFCLVSVIVVSLIRKLVIPSISNELFVFKDVMIDSSSVAMVMFSVLMITASFIMIKRRVDVLNNARPVNVFPRLLWYCIMVGTITGFLGAGGGFLLVPALVLLFDMEVKEAIGTSLLIIAMNSLIGFAMDMDHFPIDWKFLTSVTIVTGFGAFAGLALGKRISRPWIKATFGWFVLIMGIAILLNEVLSFLLKIKVFR